MIKLNYRLDKNYVLISITGQNDLEMFKQATKEFGEDERYGRRVNRVCDFRRADMSNISTIDFLRYANYSRRLAVSKSTKVALVGEKERNILMMFLNQMTNMDIRMFTKLNDAIRWVCESEAANDILDPTRGIKYHQIKGKLGMRTAMQLQQSWFGAEDYDPTLPVLWDLRDAEIEASVEELDRGATAMFTRRESKNLKVRSAVVVASREQEMVIKRAFKMGMLSGHLRVFLDEQDAVNWITIDHKDQERG